jgi:hypothetical protein
MEFDIKKRNDIKKAVFTEVAVGTGIFLFGTAITLYNYYQHNYFNSFVFYGISLIASLSLYKIGYIFYKNRKILK